MKVAIVHDWITGMRGGERVLEALCELYPEADIYTLVHVKGSVSETIEKHKIFTSFLQKFPQVEKKYRYYLPLMPLAIQSFKLKDYDLVISSSHCVAKGIIPNKEALHICYCYTPMRYIWDLYEDYFGKGRSSLPVKIAMRIIRPFLKRWDMKTSKRVDYFVAISTFIADRIKRTYGRESVVIYPPVETVKLEDGNLKLEKTGNLKQKEEKEEKKEFYLIVSAFAPYKRIDIAIGAFNTLGYKLKIVGTGQEEKKLKSIAKDNIEFLGWCSDAEIKEYYHQCKVLVFPGEEDFGIVPVEAMASGKPVIAYGKGGAKETVVDGKTGILFSPQSEEELIKAIKTCENIAWNPKEIAASVERFSVSRFKEEIATYVRKIMQEK